MADEINQAQNTLSSTDVQSAVTEALKDQKKKKKKKRLIVLGIIVFVIVFGTIVGNKPKEYDYNNPESKLTVDTILNEFRNDTANASEKYSDKVIAITGQVGTIQDDYATIRGYDDDNWLYNVNVYLKDVEDLKKFKVGDTVTIEGVCDDTTLFGDVTVRQCVIAEKFAVIPDYNNSVKVEIDDFIKAYKENQVSADSQYKGKIVELTGRVTNVTDNYIVIQSYNADVWDWDCDIEVCFEDADELKKASEGKEITIIGECNGKGAVYTAKICRAIAK